MLHRVLSIAAVLASALCLATSAHAVRIGLDARSAQIPGQNDFGTGTDFEELRQLLIDHGATLVPMTSFEAVDIAAANLDALYLQSPWLNFGGADYTSTEKDAILAFNAAGGGLALFAEAGAGMITGASNYAAIWSAFGVSYADDGTEDDGWQIFEMDDSHPVTTGLSITAGGLGYCLDEQRILTIGAPAVDLTATGAPLLPADDALAAVTGTGGAGNVVLLSDTSAFKDEGAGFDTHLNLCSNHDLAFQVGQYVANIPEPGTGALFALGLLGFAMRRSRRVRSGALVAGVVTVFGLGVAPKAEAACTLLPVDPRCTAGEFGDPFEEPTLLGLTTSENCLEDTEGELRCKITAGTLVALEDDRFLYWNALEGTENVEVTIAAEFGHVTTNDQSRLLTLAPGTDAPSWVKPSPEDGGANPDGYPDGIGPCDGSVPNTGADGSLFCSDQVMLHDGRVLAAGGTDYYSDQCIDTQFPGNVPNPVPFPPGSAELEGLKNARIFNPGDNTWTQTDSMEFGRWYPTAVTLSDGDVFISSGVTRLIKPFYPDAPFNSGRNVVQTETYDVDTGTWSNNGGLAERSLPLFPRNHLLPNGHVYYNAGGQAFNPFGQAYDQSLWNIVSTYDPCSKTWTDHAIAGFPLQLSSQGLSSIATQLNPTNPGGIQQALIDLVGEVANDPEQLAAMLDEQLDALLLDLLGLDPSDPNLALAVAGGGFRGSTFSVMLTLRPDTNGDYNVAKFLTAGGLQSSIVNPSPGDYLATTLSRVDTMDLSGATPVYSSVGTDPLNLPRWYGSGTLLPNGQVLATSGGDRDEVKTPGSEVPVVIAELFDPADNTWSQVDLQNNHRTYHNTSVLMRDGRVLVGGHAPITNSYAAYTPADARDPSFEIYSPWYVFRDDRPVLGNVSSTSLTNGGSFTADVTNVSTQGLESVVLLRRSTHTHVVDGDQRAVELRVLGQSGDTLTLEVPNANVLPPGKYVLYANNQTSDGIVPSEGVSLSVGPGAPVCP